MKSKSDSYKEAGVDIRAGYRSVELIKETLEATHRPGVLSGIGGFAGLFEPDLSGLKRPVLVSGTDGVGTKLKIAFALDRHDTVGIDCVAMCVNDILCSGAKPLFFLDYIACGRLVPEKIAAIVSGVARGCLQAGAALIGGETAEMPGFYPDQEYDLAGFAVGLADKEALIRPEKVREGDVAIGLPSSGLHSNGFSLVRKIFSTERRKLEAHVDELGKSLGEALLAPTEIYVKPVLSLMEQLPVHGLAHITGGGLVENLPRMMPPGLSLQVTAAAIPPQPLFALIQKQGDIPREDMWNTFNMGLGFCLLLPEEAAHSGLALLAEEGLAPFVLGQVQRGEEALVLC